MKRSTLFIFFALLFWFVACQPQEEVNPDKLPANYDYAAGDASKSVTLKGVTIQVDETSTRPGNEPPDQALKPGYVYVVVKMTITNQSQKSVLATEFRLIDEYLNLYESWQTSAPFSRELTALPAEIGPGQSATGEQVFIVPQAALSANLRLRWQSGVQESRIDLSLGQLPPPQ
ncbi:MAG TPA: DUF4352 domain-containing protein [Chloroflexota bacterium]|nr:DUF4352 domain-containing protein [Chloroflexota bacterium]